MVYSDPALWEEAKRAARERLGGHSARAMQLAGQLYRAAGGRYVGRKTKAQRSLTSWTGQNWTTKSGKPSRETGERYLPRRVIEQLTSAEYAATSRAKRKGTKQGNQYVKQPAKIAAKVARLKAQQNPRPRKYASAAEKQAAFRARFPTLCVRVEPKTADTVQAVADASGRTQQETLLSMLKYAMTNRNWITLGLTEHKQLPRIEEPRKANPMKRKPTPAQIAARERFAEMARSGAFKKKAAKRNPRKKTVSEKISQLSREGYPQKQAVAIALSEERAGKVRRNPISYGLDGVVNITDTYERSVASSRNLAEHYANQLRMRGRDDIVYVVFGITPQAKAQAGRYRNGVTITLDPRDYEIAYAFHPTQGEISRQLKAQRDAERRAYTRQGMKLKSNPRASNPIVLVTDRKPSKRKANPVKPKDMTVYQVQYRKPGMKLFEPWMTVMYPKMAEDIARRLADEPMAQTWTIKVESIKVKS